MATAADWVAGARPRTLPSAIAPVAIGTGSAAALDSVDIPRAGLALIVALALQVGVNYANDYSDGVRGTDADGMRVGPMRLVGSGVARPAQVKTAALIAFAVAALAGLTLTILAGAWWFLGVGVAALAAAWFYTGGRTPYGYRGLGEISVFVFFGLVATLGTTWAQAGRWDVASFAGAVGVGLISCAVLAVNNLRDIPGDRQVGKQTLAVRLGEPGTRILFAALLAGAFLAIGLAGVIHPWALLGLVAAPLAIAPIRTVLGGAQGRELISVLGGTGLLLLGYAAALTTGLAVAGITG